MRVLVLAGLAAALAAACTQETPKGPEAAARPAETPAPQPPAIASVEGKINWDAARADLSKRPADAPVLPQSVMEKEAVVPMLLPSGIVQTASDRPSPPVITKDGYFANYHLPRYDAIVNGSMKAYAAPGQAATADKEAMKFTTGDASAQLTFSRYGADYIIEFECRQVDGPEGCITEAEAREFADSLFVAQTR